MRWATAAAVLLGAASSAGCGYLGSARGFDPAEFSDDPGWVRVEGLMCLRQAGQEDCGAAALAMVLAYWDAPGGADDVLRACAPSPDAPIAAGALRDFARAQGLRAYLFPGDWDDLRREVSAGRPVIVGLAKPYVTGLRSHYEVVAAYHQERRLLATLDPARGWRQNSPEGFLAEWAATGRLTLVAFRPEPEGR
jgi:ABC-type bacteriocin/lantibiotic exporter with double-glycine peptidase domain